MVENFRPGTLEKWGMGWEQLHALNPGLILVRVSGYGQTGPFAQLPGYAAVGEAMGGLRSLVGYPDRPSTRVGISIGDSLAGMFGAIGALAALEARHRTGRGQVVDASIYESVLGVTESLVADWSALQVRRERTGPILPGIAPSNVYPTADGEVIIAANQDTVFGRLCTAMGRPELAADPRFADHRARGEHQAELDGIIGKWSETLASGELLERLRGAAVPSGLLYSPADMMDDVHMRARGSLVDVPTEGYGPVTMQAAFPVLSETPGSVRWGGQPLGAETDGVLRDVLGLSEDRVAELRDTGGDLGMGDLTAPRTAPASYGRFERAQERAAYEGLRELILSRRIAAGDPIEIESLSGDLDVEPHQLEAAIARLAQSSWSARDAEGAFLAAPVTVEVADGLFDARTVIEIGVIDGFASRLTADDLAELDRLAHALATIVSEAMPDLGRFLEASHDYHSYLVGSAHSAPLTAAYLRLGISRLWRSSIAELDWWNLFDVRHHSELTAALRSGDTARAKELVYEHQEQVKALVREVIARHEGALRRVAGFAGCVAQLGSSACIVRAPRPPRAADQGLAARADGTWRGPPRSATPN